SFPLPPLPFLLSFVPFLSSPLLFPSFPFPSFFLSFPLPSFFPLLSSPPLPSLFSFPSPFLSSLFSSTHSYFPPSTNDRGHLLPSIPRSKASPWGTYMTTWDMPLKIPPAKVSLTSRSIDAAARLTEWMNKSTALSQACNGLCPEIVGKTFHDPARSHPPGWKREGCPGRKRRGSLTDLSPPPSGSPPSRSSRNPSLNPAGLPVKPPSGPFPPGRCQPSKRLGPGREPPPTALCPASPAAWTSA
uniref:Protein Flattop n=1 Tax=Pseudonaja textilis TaxID=8673 RepID=A0A670ZIG3_PSETE